MAKHYSNLGLKKRLTCLGSTGVHFALIKGLIYFME